MILLDANLLIYAVNEDAPLNRKAKSWLESALSGQETVGFPWNVLLTFLRLTTRPGLFRRPLQVGRAFDLMAYLLAQTSATILHPAAPRPTVERFETRPVQPDLGGHYRPVRSPYCAAPGPRTGSQLCYAAHPPSSSRS